MKDRKKTITLLEVSKRERVMLVAVLVGMLTIFYTLLYKVQSKQIVAIEGQINAIKKKGDSDKMTLMGLNQKITITKKDNQQSSYNIDELSPASNIAKMIKGVVENSSEKLFQLSRIALETSEIDEGVRKSTFNLEIKSPFITLAKFLDNLEQSADWISIMSIDINRFERELKECQGAVKLNTYEIERDKK